MEIQEYQRLSTRTLNKDLTKEQQVSNMVAGIFGEGGEVADQIKKAFYQGHELDKKHLQEELGDLMFYVTNLATIYNISMENVLEDNINKLKKRYKNGFSAKASIDRIDKK